MRSEWNNESVLCRLPLSPLDTWPALSTPNAESWCICSSDRFLTQVLALSGPADVSASRVVKSPVPEGKFADPKETKETKGKGCPEHQTVVSFFLGGCLQSLLSINSEC